MKIWVKFVYGKNSQKILATCLFFTKVQSTLKKRPPCKILQFKYWVQARRVASGGAMPPRFSFLPPRFISCPPRYFFGMKKLLFLAGKNVEICDFRQKKPSDFGEDLFFFFWRSPAFGRKKTLKFRLEKAFGNRRKPLPPDFNFAPPISRSWRRPWYKPKARQQFLQHMRLQFRVTELVQCNLFVNRSWHQELGFWSYVCCLS